MKRTRADSKQKKKEREKNTLVVLDLPPLCVLGLGPGLELGQREEAELLCSLGALDNGGHKLNKEAVELEERGPEVVDEVDEKPLDVRAVLILIGHDHQLAVAQRLQAFVGLAVLKTLSKVRPSRSTQGKAHN